MKQAYVKQTDSVRTIINKDRHMPSLFLHSNQSEVINMEEWKHKLLGKVDSVEGFNKMVEQFAKDNQIFRQVDHITVEQFGSVGVKHAYHASVWYLPRPVKTQEVEVSEDGNIVTEYSKESKVIHGEMLSMEESGKIMDKKLGIEVPKYSYLIKVDNIGKRYMSSFKDYMIPQNARVKVHYLERANPKNVDFPYMNIVGMRIEKEDE